MSWLWSWTWRWPWQRRHLEAIAQRDSAAQALADSRRALQKAQAHSRNVDRMAQALRESMGGRRT